MPSLIDLRRRVRAVKNTQQITKAMKMVAASKLRRAQERIMARGRTRMQMQRVLGERRPRASIRRCIRCSTAREPRPGEPDAGDRRHRATRGCAAASTPTSSRRARHSSPSSATGRARSGWSAAKGATSSRAAASTVLFEQVGIFQKLALRRRAGDRADGDRRVHVGAGRSRDARLQRVQVGDDAARRRRSAAADRAGDVDAGAPARRAAGRSAQIDYLYEPSPQEIFNQLLPRYVEVQVYRALLESNAAFFAAQMTAMDTATQELRGDDRQPDALHEQGAPGGDHARDHRSRVGRAGAVSESGLGERSDLIQPL